MSIPFDFQIALDKLHLDPSFKAIIAAAVVAGQQFDFDLYARNAEDNRDTLKSMFKAIFDQTYTLVERNNADTDHFESACTEFEDWFTAAFADVIEQQSGRSPQARQYSTTNHAQQGVGR